MGNQVHKNHIQTNHSTEPDNHINEADIDPKALEMYQSLITMGFSENLSLEAAKTYPESIEDAMDWIMNREAIDKIMKDENASINNNNNNIESDHKQNQFIPLPIPNKNDLSDGYNAENDEEDEEEMEYNPINNSNPIINNNDAQIHNDNNNEEDDTYFAENKEEEAINNNMQSLELSNKNSNDISEALQTADIVIKGEYNPDASPEAMLIISDLINAVLYNDNDNISNPMIKPFIRWTNKIKHVKLNSFYYQEICNYLLITHKRVKNLYALDKINGVFKNVEVIECYHTGWISLYYLELLLDVLDKIHYLEYSKLNKIYLNDINNIGSINNDFEKYQNLFRQKNWNIEKGVSNLIVSRYY